jgi:hypothetical protein
MSVSSDASEVGLRPTEIDSLFSMRQTNLVSKSGREGRRRSGWKNHIGLSEVLKTNIEVPGLKVALFMPNGLLHLPSLISFNLSNSLNLSCNNAIDDNMFGVSLLYLIN